VEVKGYLERVAAGASVSQETDDTNAC
jgi:hypothetical protein